MHISIAGHISNCQLLSGIFGNNFDLTIQIIVEDYYVREFIAFSFSICSS